MNYICPLCKKNGRFMFCRYQPSLFYPDLGYWKCIARKPHYFRTTEDLEVYPSQKPIVL